MSSISRSALIAMAAMTACAAGARDPAGPGTSAFDGPQHPCRDKPVQPLVGRVADPATRTEAMRLSHASEIRIVRPGEPLAMDYSTGRLTIEVDAGNRILRLYCS